MIELAVVLPMFVLLLFGMAEASRMCMVAQLLANAAREGCRVAASKNKTQADVTARVNATLAASGMVPAKVTTTITISPARANVQSSIRGDKINVTLTVPFRDVNWLPSPFFYGGTTPVRGVAVMCSERP
jgi:Flp pilus assembly protein TadG